MTSERDAEVLLGAARLMVGVSVLAADQLGEASLVQLRALTVLSELRVANLMQLAEQMGVTISTTSRLVDRLVTAGFADRRPSPQTRREISISLTDTGRAILRRYDDLRVEALDARLGHLPQHDRRSVIDGLSALLGTTSPATAEPAGRT